MPPSDGSDDEQQVTAHEYDEWFTQDSLGARWGRFWFSPKRTIFLNTPIRKLPRELSLKSSDRVLDIGCGYAGSLIYLHGRVGFTSVMEGIDCSHQMIEGARVEVANRGLNDRIHLKVGLATKLPYADQTFDHVLCTFVIKHLSDDLLRDMFREVSRVLRPGGRFSVWEAAPSRYGFMRVWNMKLMKMGVSVVHLRTAEDLRGLLEQAGFAGLQPFGHGLYYYYPPMPRRGFIATRP